MRMWLLCGEWVKTGGDLGEWMALNEEEAVDRWAGAGV